MVADKELYREQVLAMIQRLRGFIVLVNWQTQNPMEAWVMKFQAGGVDLEKVAKTRAKELKPGKLEVTATNASAFGAGVTASLDGMEARMLEGTSCVFGSVASGPHIVQVKGAKGGRTLQASEIIRMQPDSAATVNLALPSPESPNHSMGQPTKVSEQSSLRQGTERMGPGNGDMVTSVNCYASLRCCAFAENRRTVTGNAFGRVYSRALEHTEDA